jgi:hypothetical protein
MKEEDIVELYDFIEQYLTLEDVKALFVALMDGLFDGDKEKSLAYMQRYLDKKKADKNIPGAVKKRFF